MIDVTCELQHLAHGLVSISEGAQEHADSYENLGELFGGAAWYMLESPQHTYWG